MMIDDHTCVLSPGGWSPCHKLSFVWADCSDISDGKYCQSDRLICAFNNNESNSTSDLKRERGGEGEMKDEEGEVHV